jgi:hypothetical protein
MPYTVLVSALGAIVATAFGLFVMHSFAAAKIAAPTGAVLGLLFAIVSLRRYGLSLNASLEQYRGAAGVPSLKEVFSLYVKIAFGVGTAASIVELPTLLIGQQTALSTCAAGWIVIVGYTLFRAWRIGDRSSFGKLDVFQTVGGVATLMIFGAFLSEVVVGLWAGMPTESLSGPTLIRMILLLNAGAAMEAAVIAVFGLNLLHRVSGVTSSQRS